MAVRLDIRPRLRLAPDWQPTPVARPRFRLPPLALRAIAYWAAMAALTYGFTRLGPHPLDDALARERPPLVTEPPRPVPPEPNAPVEEPLAASSVPEPAMPPSEPEAPATLAAEAAPVVAPSRAQEAPAAPSLAKSPEPAWERPSEPDRAPSELPEFTDSRAPRARERAADGPRIDSLFERATPSPDAPSSAAAPASTADVRPPIALTSCEAAIAKNSEQLEIGGPRGPADITREAYASILQNGNYLSSCRLPERTVFEICAAVKNGRAVGITVVSSPPSNELNACVRRAVSRLTFPSNERLDVTHTRFDAVKR